MSSIVVTPYQPTMDIKTFWNSLEAQWTAGAKRREDFDGRPVFKDNSCLFEFFVRRQVRFVQNLFDMKEQTVKDYGDFDVYEKAALIEIIQLVSKAAIQAGFKQNMKAGPQQLNCAAPTAPTNSTELMSLRKELETTRAQLTVSKKRCMQLEEDVRVLQVDRAKHAKIAEVWKPFYRLVAMDSHPDKTSHLTEADRKKREELFKCAANVNDTFNGK